MSKRNGFGSGKYQFAVGALNTDCEIFPKL